MPYVKTPPGACKASKIVTLKPSFARSAAQESPEGPEPIIEILMFFWEGFKSSFSFSLCQSATKRSNFPIATLSPLIFLMQELSHWVSCGQTLPQTAARLEDLLIIAYALL